MRFYRSFKEVINEIERDLAELGITIITRSFQNKQRKEGFGVKEISPYVYTWLEPNKQEIVPYLDSPEYARKEFEERISGLRLNPGEAWKLRGYIWKTFLKEGKFDYTYSERIGDQVERVKKLLEKDLYTRRAVIIIFQNKDIERIASFGVRIPCSIFYQFLYRNKRLDLIYSMRSCDFKTHFPYDVYFAVSLQEHVAKELGLEIGKFVHFIGSLHVFKDEVDGVF